MSMYDRIYDMRCCGRFSKSLHPSAIGEAGFALIFNEEATMDRVILHCDMNGFFASVELLDYPELADKPMAVCGNPENRHGIILAKMK